MSRLSIQEARGRLLTWLQAKSVPEGDIGNDGRCVIKDSNNQDCLLWMPNDSTTLRLYVHLESLDTQHDMDLIVFAMAMNLDGSRSCDLTLGYNPDSNQLLACGRLDFGTLDLAELDENLMDMLEQVVLIREELALFRLHRVQADKEPPTRFNSPSFGVMP